MMDKQAITNKLIDSYELMERHKCKISYEGLLQEQIFNAFEKGFLNGYQKAIIDSSENSDRISAERKALQEFSRSGKNEYNSELKEFFDTDDDVAIKLYNAFALGYYNGYTR